MEFAIHGKFPIICGSATYSGLGIALECNTKKNYFNLLAKLNHLPKMSNSKRLLAKKFFILWNIINFTDYQN